MRKACVLFFVLFLPLLLQAQGVIVNGAPWPDANGVHINAHGGGILSDRGTYYWFGEHKTPGEGGNLANVGVHCYSSQDLIHWQDEGIALAVDPEGSGSDIEKGCILERPKVVRNARTGRYVMWFHLEPKGKGYGGARSGVAVADRVTGPYRFLRSVRPNAGHYPVNALPVHRGPVRCEGLKFDGGSIPGNVDSLNILGRDFQGGQMARDMTLFVDDDGTCYHIYSSEENSTLHIARLTDDYLAHSGVYKRIFPGRFMEAPAMCKRDGKYYLILSGCTGWAPNAARSAVADEPMGEWRELGNPCRGPEAGTTYRSQSTFILTLPGGEYVYMGDRWNPKDAIDGRYVWLPLEFTAEGIVMPWKERWTLSLAGK